MKRSSGLHSICAALLVAGLGFAWSADAEDGAARVATANPSRILSAMKKTIDKNASEQQERVALDAESKQKVAEIKDMEKARDESKAFPKGSKEYREATNKILEKTIQLQAWGELKKAELARRHKEEIKALFDEITAAIAQVAQDKKIDLVIADTSAEIPADLDSVTPEQLHGLIRQKNILYANPKGVDISDEVIIRLDAAYKANK